MPYGSILFVHRREKGERRMVRERGSVVVDGAFVGGGRTFGLRQWS